MPARLAIVLLLALGAAPRARTQAPDSTDARSRDLAAWLRHVPSRSRVHLAMPDQRLEGELRAVASTYLMLVTDTNPVRKRATRVVPIADVDTVVILHRSLRDARRRGALAGGLIVGVLGARAARDACATDVCAWHAVAGAVLGFGAGDALGSVVGAALGRITGRGKPTTWTRDAAH